MAYTDEIDYVATGSELLLSQFYGKPRIEGLLQSYLNRLVEIQDDTNYLLQFRGIDSATGYQLDLIGKIVGQNREGRNDDSYRIIIKVKILVNNSNGTPKEVLQILKSVTNATVVRMFEHFPANIHLFTNGKENLDIIYSVMRSVVPACISDVVIMANHDNGVTIPGEFKGSELSPSEFKLTPMVDDLGRYITDSFGNQIVITAATGEYTGDAILEELPPYGGGEGKPLAEIYDKNR